MKRTAVGIAAAIILIADAYIVFRAISARRARPDAVLQLSERELPMPPRPEKNSALFVDLRWRTADVPGWLTTAKLDELGAKSDRSGARRALAVLELQPDTPGDGARLALVDAGLDAAALRARHPDRGRCAILPAIVRRNLRPPQSQAGGPGWIIVERRLVYVPPEYFNVLRAARSYEATLCLKDTGELWLCGARNSTRD